jgi:hypothetical protein
MAVKKRRRRKVNEEVSSEIKAAQLAPLEEQKVMHQTDTLRLETAEINMPKNLFGAETETARIFHPHRVVVVLIGILLAFIAFIAYLISQMPDPSR